MTTEHALIRSLLAAVRAGFTTSGHLAAPSTESYGRCVRNYHATIVDGRHVQVGRCCALCRQAVAAIEAADEWLLEHSARQLELIEVAG